MAASPRTETATSDILLDGLGVPECLRWHDGALWFTDMATGQVVRFDPLSAGTEPVVVETLPHMAAGIGWLPDGRMLLVSSEDRRVLRLEPDGELVEHADLSQVASWHVNDLLVARSGVTYVGNFGFDLHAAQRNKPTSALFEPGAMQATPIACLSPDGDLIGVSEPMLFPNGMVEMPDGRIVAAETLHLRLVEFTPDERGVLTQPTPWASFLPDPAWNVLTASGVRGKVARSLSAALDRPPFNRLGPAPIGPDGISLDPDGKSIWVANAQGAESVRIAKGGKVLARAKTSQMTLCSLAVDQHDGTVAVYSATVQTHDRERGRELMAGRIERAVFRR